jgi:DNA-directed RNA polymerase subunit RPC12/RpoP
MANPHWVVTCSHCQKTFAYSDIPEPRDLQDYYLPAKPEIPARGQELQCPHCNVVSAYRRSDLRYEAAGT